MRYDLQSDNRSPMHSHRIDLRWNTFSLWDNHVAITCTGKLSEAGNWEVKESLIHCQ